MVLSYKRRGVGDFPGSSADGTSPSNAGSVGLIPGWGAGVPHAALPVNQNSTDVIL